MVLAPVSKTLVSEPLVLTHRLLTASFLCSLDGLIPSPDYCQVCLPRHSYTLHDRNDSLPPPPMQLQGPCEAIGTTRVHFGKFDDDTLRLFGGCDPLAHCTALLQWRVFFLGLNPCWERTLLHASLSFSHCGTTRMLTMGECVGANLHLIHGTQPNPRQGTIMLYHHHVPVLWSTTPGICHYSKEYHSTPSWVTAMGPRLLMHFCLLIDCPTPTQSMGECVSA
jgi:hypothetical protein